MSEVVEGYSKDVFVHYPILDELTQQVKDQHLTPLEAYVQFDIRRNGRGLNPYIHYCSTSITTGGHARREDLPNMPEVIAANTVTARRIASLLHKQGSLEAAEVILPVDLGHTGWNQSQFMAFWVLMLSGVNTHEISRVPKGFSQLESNLQQALDGEDVNIELMNSKHATRNEKALEYKNFSLAMAGALTSYPVGILRPASRFVSFVDTRVSLGCWGEEVFADQLHIPKRRLVELKPASLYSSIPDQALKEELKIITPLGAEVMVATAASRLALERNAAPAAAMPDLIAQH